MQTPRQRATARGPPGRAAAPWSARACDTGRAARSSWRTQTGTRQVVGIATASVGILLIVIGLNASQAPVGRITETFTGRISNATMRYLVGGGAAIVAGGVLALRLRRA